MFTPTTHPLTGETVTYAPQGYTPTTEAEARKDTTGTLITFPGDTVTVESAWTRPYLDADAPTLLYVRSHATGERTHVTAADLSTPYVHTGFECGAL